MAKLLSFCTHFRPLGFPLGFPQVPALLLFAGLGCLGLHACARPSPGVVAEAYARNSRKAKLDVPRPERMVVRDPVTRQILVDKHRVSTGARGFTNEGSQRTWYPSGGPKTFREYTANEPTGQWLTWWATGLLQSSYVFDPGRETPMVWWHANGVVASEGLARNGQRVGPWIYRGENGAISSEGSYSGGKRDGQWTFYGEDGEWTERGRYVAGRRVGEWEHAGARLQLGR